MQLILVNEIVMKYSQAKSHTLQVRTYVRIRIVYLSSTPITVPPMAGFTPYRTLEQPPATAMERQLVTQYTMTILIAHDV